MDVIIQITSSIKNQGNSTVIHNIDGPSINLADIYTRNNKNKGKQASLVINKEFNVRKELLNQLNIANLVVGPVWFVGGNLKEQQL